MYLKYSKNLEILLRMLGLKSHTGFSQIADPLILTVVT